MNYLEAAQSAIRQTYGCEATYQESVLVTERHQGKVVWDGQVEVFSLPQQQSGATRCYAWGYEDAGQMHFICVMGIVPIASPEALTMPAWTSSIIPSSTPERSTAARITSAARSSGRIPERAPQ